MPIYSTRVRDYMATREEDANKHAAATHLYLVRA